MADTKSVGIFYFSGTGNTEIVTTLLAEKLKRRVHVEILKIEDILKGKTDFQVEKYDIIGIGYPVHALNAPRIVFDFIRRLPSGNKRAFIFKTSGDPFMNGGPTLLLRDRLNEKGYTVFYERLVVMPANVLVQYHDRLVKQLYNAAVEKTERMCEDILSGKVDLQKNGQLSGAAYLFSGLEWIGAPFFGKDLKVRDSCNLCNECVRKCPKNNISRKGDTITFGWKCMMCMRCIYNCPEGAIRPRLYGVFILREYNIKKIIADPDIRGDYLTGDTRGYFRRFYNYVKS